LPDDSASVPALQSIDRLLRWSSSVAQLLTRCSLVVLLLSQVSRTAHFRKTSDFFNAPRPELRKSKVCDDVAAIGGWDYMGIKLNKPVF